MLDPEENERSSPTWRDGAYAWILCALLIAGLLIAGVFEDAADYLAAARGEARSEGVVCRSVALPQAPHVLRSSCTAQVADNHKN